MLKLATLLLLVLSGYTTILAQDGLRSVRPMAGLSIGVERPRMEVLSGSDFRAGPSLAASMDLGLSWTYRERFGVVVMGTLAVNGYNFARESYSYGLYHITERVELRPFWQKPLNEGRASYLRGALGVGFALQGASSLEHYTGPLVARTTAEADRRLYLAPELSILKNIGKNRLEFGLRYVRHVERRPAFSTILFYGTNTTLATAVHDHFAAVARFHLGMRKPQLPVMSPPAMDFADRVTDTLTTLYAGRERITLRLWDNAEYDGDTLSIFLNGNPVLVGHELKRKRSKLKLDLLLGENILLVVAHNEGRVPPNTASVMVRAGKGRQGMLVRTSIKTNQMVRIIRKDAP